MTLAAIPSGVSAEVVCVLGRGRLGGTLTSARSPSAHHRRRRRRRRRPVERGSLRSPTRSARTPTSVPDGHRAHYHAAAVMASTYVVTLAAQARGLLLSLGWSDADALDAIVTLLHSALENLERAREGADA